MTGYFSQLAQHTGLALEPARAPASGGATESPVADQPAPLHLEASAFTEAATAGVVEGAGSDPASLAPAGANGAIDARTAPAAVPASRPNPVASTDDDPARSAREHSAEARPAAGEPPLVQPSERSGTATEAGPPASDGITYESIVIADSHAAVYGRPLQVPRAPAVEHDRPQREQPPRAREPVAVRGERVERELIVHQYLQEVTAWVAGTPEGDEREPERPSTAHDDALAREPPPQPRAPQADRPAAPEVQDLTLSIGTISIVIEEPGDRAPAALPAPPRVDRSSEPRASEPTRLSRYYLGRW